MKLSIVIMAVLSVALVGPVLAQAPQTGAGPGSPTGGKLMTMSITGKIAKTEQGYIIQGQEPPELFTILNPNPQVLDSLVKSGKNVIVEAVSVMGDNVNIRVIDGKAYRESEAAKPSEK